MAAFWAITNLSVQVSELREHGCRTNSQGYNKATAANYCNGPYSLEDHCQFTGTIQRKIKKKVIMDYDADAHFNLQIISISILFNSFQLLEHVHRYRHYICVYTYVCFVYIVINQKKKKKNEQYKSSLVWGQTKWTAGEYVTSENFGTFALCIKIHSK